MKRLVKYDFFINESENQELVESRKKRLYNMPEVPYDDDKVERLLRRVNDILPYEVTDVDDALEGLRELQKKSDDIDLTGIIKELEDVYDEEMIYGSAGEANESIKEAKDNGTIIFEMTGSPRSAMMDMDPKLRTKAEFYKRLKPHGYLHGRLNENCDMLVTNDLSSSSAKMEKAKDLDIKIVTYAQLIKKYKLF